MKTKLSCQAVARRRLVLLLSTFSFLLSTFCRADTPIKDVKISGTASQISSGAFAVKTGVVVTYEAGSTLDTTAATLKVGTISGATNANVVVAPNGTGKLDLRAAALRAGTATAGTAPLKFTSGTLLTAAEAGAVEFDGSWIYFSTSTPVRKRLSTETNATAIAASAIDWSLASTFTKTLSANTTFTFSNATDGQTIVVALTNTASNYTVTWPTVSWSAAAAPVQTVGAKTDVYTFIKIGSVIYGSAVQNF